MFSILDFSSFSATFRKMLEVLVSRSGGMSRVMHKGGSHMKVSAITGVIVLALVLVQGTPGAARQNILPAGSAPQTIESVDHAGGPAVRVSHNTATVSWQLVDDPRVVGYEVWKGTTANSLSPRRVGNVTTFTFDGLTQGQTWYFGVSSYDASGNRSVLSNIVMKTIDKNKVSH